MISRVHALHIAPGRKIPTKSLDSVEAEACVGLVGDRYHGAKHRHVTVQALDVFQWEPDRTWPVVTANLYSTILIEIAPKLAAAVEPEGTLVISGVMRDQEADVMKALAKHKLAPMKVARQGKWIAAVLKKELKAKRRA